MDNIRLPEKNTATRNSIEVALKALVGFVSGLVVVIWAVPGVQEAVVDYVTKNWMQVALAVGIPSAFTGLINFWFDWQKKGMRNFIVL